MRGEIKAADVLRHPLAIAVGFGPRVLVRCLLAVVTGRRCTFLELAVGR